MKDTSIWKAPVFERHHHLKDTSIWKAPAFERHQHIVGNLNKLNMPYHSHILNSVCAEVLKKVDLFQSYYINSQCIFTVTRTYNSLHIYYINSYFWWTLIDKHDLPQIYSLPQVHNYIMFFNKVVRIRTFSL